VKTKKTDKLRKASKPAAPRGKETK
jgi:hypothetical protein